jgi:UDP-glucose 4-epimerase
MKVLVTGGAGFIGSHLAERLVGEGHEVIVYDNLSSGRRENVAGFADKVTFIEADVRDAPQLDFYLTGCDVVFHQAAVVSVPYSVEHPQETHDVNIQGTLNVLLSAKRRGVKRVVFASSAAVYGDEAALPNREAMEPRPISPYGIEKMCGEMYMRAWPTLYGTGTVSLRYFNVFGPRQDPSSPYSGVISIFVDRALKGTTPTVFGDGTQCRDFVYVGNVVDANLRAATRARIEGGVYNVARGERTTLNQLLAMLGRIAGRDLAPEYAAARPGDIKESVADIGRARADLGYEPTIGVEEGLRRLVEYERQRRT